MGKAILTDYIEISINGDLGSVDPQRIGRFVGIVAHAEAISVCFPI